MVFNKKVPLVRGVGEVLEKEQTVPSKINYLFFYSFTFSLALYIFGHTGMGGKYFKIRQWKYKSEFLMMTKMGHFYRNYFIGSTSD